MVVDLAVDGHDQRAVLAEERLRPALHVDDGEPAEGEGQAPVVVEGGVVRAPVGEPLAHLLEDRAPLLRPPRRALEKAGEAAHQRTAACSSARTSASANGAPVMRSAPRSPPGENTLISSSRSPATSRPTRKSPSATSRGPIAAATRSAPGRSSTGPISPLMRKFERGSRGAGRWRIAATTPSTASGSPLSMNSRVTPSAAAGAYSWATANPRLSTASSAAAKLRSSTPERWKTPSPPAPCSGLITTGPVSVS